VTGPRRWAGPVTCGLVLAAALLVGAGAFSDAVGTAAARAAGIESLIAAPPRGDLSIAQSNSPASRALRHQVAVEVARGWSDGRILDGIAARYGTQILLEPPAGGLDTVLWAAPVALGVAAVAALATVAVRRRRRT
jgi:cytochrome c-type biogenesis protein CcmH/NrfF